MEQHKDDLREVGLAVIAVAMGEPRHAQHYCGKLAPSAICLTSETNKPYFTYGLTRTSYKDLLSPSVIAAGVRAYSKGHRNGRVIGDPLMMPGNFIVDRQGIVHYTYYSEHAGDHPPIQSIIQAAKQES